MANKLKSRRHKKRRVVSSKKRKLNLAQKDIEKKQE